MRMWLSIEESLKRAGLFRRQDRAFQTYLRLAKDTTNNSPAEAQVGLIKTVLDEAGCPEEFRRVVD